MGVYPQLMGKQLEEMETKATARTKAERQVGLSLLRTGCRATTRIKGVWSSRRSALTHRTSPTCFLSGGKTTPSALWCFLETQSSLLVMSSTGWALSSKCCPPSQERVSLPSSSGGTSSWIKCSSPWCLPSLNTSIWLIWSSLITVCRTLLLKPLASSSPTAPTSPRSISATTYSALEEDRHRP